MKKYVTLIIICTITLVSICPIYTEAGEEITITSLEIVEKLSRLQSLFYGLEKKFDGFEKYIEKRFDGFEKRLDGFEKRLDDYKWFFGIIITVLGYIILEIIRLKQITAIIQKDTVETKNDIAFLKKSIEELKNNLIGKPEEKTDYYIQFKEEVVKEQNKIIKDQMKLSEKVDQILQYLKLPDLTPSAQLAQ